MFNSIFDFKGLHLFEFFFFAFFFIGLNDVKTSQK